MARFDDYVEKTRSSRIIILAATLVATLIAGFGLTFIKFDRDPRVYFSVDSPERVAFESLEDRYGSYRAAIFVVQRENEKKLDNDVLRALDMIEDRTKKIEEIQGISSAASVPVFEAAEKGGPLRSLNDLGTPQEAELTGLSNKISDDPDKFDGLVSENGVVALVKTNIKTEKRDDETLKRVIADVKEIRDDVREKYPDVQVLLTGDAITTDTFGEAFRDDLRMQVPLQFLAMLIFLIISFRSFSATMAMMSVLILGIIMTMGIAGWMGVVLNGVSAGTVTVLMGLTIATCVHIMISWQHGTLEGSSSQLSLVRTMRSNIKPVSLALLTTVMSFLSLNMSDSPAFQDLGNLVSIGLVIILILSFTWLPAIMTFLPPKTEGGRRWGDELMVKLGGVISQYRMALLAATILLLAGSIFGVSMIKFDDRFAKYFDHRFEFRVATDIFEEHFAGIGKIHFSVPADENDSVDKRDYLQTVGEFAKWLKDQDEVAEVLSIVDLYKVAAPAVGTELDEVGAPKTDEGVTKARDFIKDKLDQKLKDRVLGPDDKESKVTVVFKSASSREILDFADRAEKKLVDIKEEQAATATGLAVLAGKLSSRNTDAMLVGTALALVAISIIMIFMLGNLTYGLISIVPNVLPMLFAYGFFGLVFGEVSFAGTMVCAMTFGIVVDDTVHFLNKYNYFRTIRLLPPKEAVIETLRTVGVAIVITTFALGLGFLALSFSGFLVNHHLGLLTLLTLISALIADLLLLPALLMLVDRRKTEARADLDEEPSTETPSIIGDANLIPAAVRAMAEAKAQQASAQGPDTISDVAAKAGKAGERLHGWLLDIDRKSKPVPLTGAVQRIGRSPDNDVVVLDRTVHRSHAVLSEESDGRYVITDLSPDHGNGIWLNGRKVKQSTVENGDLIELGEVRVRFLDAA